MPVKLVELFAGQLLAGPISWFISQLDGHLDGRPVWWRILRQVEIHANRQTNWNNMACSWLDWRKPGILASMWAGAKPVG
jgi:hypothetical protein